ncbi:MAG: hypothetical protein F8N39_03530 [Clostridiaceae bacterium]|nr:hypothetical protein [Clostridiaceae bacterium]
MEKYNQKLLRYPPNFLIECEMSELDLRYYGNIFKARDRLLKALELRPKDAFCHHSLGLIYHYLGIPEKSIHHCKIAIENSEDSYSPCETKARSLFNIATTYVNVYGKNEEAIKMIEKALEVMPDYKQAKNGLKQLKRRRLW